MKKKTLFYSTPILILGFFFLYYLLQEVHYEVRLPIDFIPYTNQPRTEVIIEGKKYPLMIDLGSSSRLTLRTDILNKLQKIPIGETQNFDVKGNEYKSKLYLLPEIKIRNMKLTRIEAIDEGDDFLVKGSILHDDSRKTKNDVAKDKPGRIGRKLFTDVNANLFLDFHNSLIFACCHLDDRKKDGYRIKKFVSASFELNDTAGIVLTMDTDLGIKRFMLDTGCTRSLIKSSAVVGLSCREWKPGLYLYNSSKFSFGGRDFGSIDLLVVEMSSILENLDGIIGMDFLKDHIIYIDFQKKKLYLGKSDECSCSKTQDNLTNNFIRFYNWPCDVRRERSECAIAARGFKAQSKIERSVPERRSGCALHAQGGRDDLAKRIEAQGGGRGYADRTCHRHV